MMPRISLILMATDLAPALGLTEAHPAPTEKQPGDGRDLYGKDFTGAMLTGAKIDGRTCAAESIGACR
jgi:hypothetical protein